MSDLNKRLKGWNNGSLKKIQFLSPTVNNIQESDEEEEDEDEQVDTQTGVFQ